MKQFFLCVALLAVSALTALATPVSPENARKAAANFLSSAGMKGGEKALVDITAQTPFEHLYVFKAAKGNGFVIVAGDDNSEPVLAYSLDNAFDAEAMPAHVRGWLELYDKAVLYNSVTPRSETASEEWQMVLSDNPIPQSKEVIPPMLETQWNQSPYYNLYCPADSASGVRPPCGCTATATAQIMKHFAHPATGYGAESYDHPTFGTQQADYGQTNYNWSVMPNKLGDYSSEEEINAVAEIIYHVGVAVHMDYKLGGSAGKTASYGYGGEPSSENAFKYNFRYSPYVWTAFRCDYGDEAWHDLMLNEITNGRPVLYAGYDEVQSGHAFVLDGYNTANKCFHLNWGWGGTYDGYFKIVKLNPGPPNNKYNFNLFATATIGIEPYDAFDPTSTTTVSTGVEFLHGAVDGDGSVTGEGTYNFGDTITLTAMALNEHTRFVQWSDGCRYNPRVTVATGGQLSFTAQFAPVHVDTIGYYTTGNAMNRASNIPYGLGLDSVWGIKIPSTALWQHHDLTAVRFMGRKAAMHTLTVYAGTDSPDEELYSATFYDSLDYAYTWHTHTLPTPIDIDCSKNLWVVLKCTEIDTPGVFSIYGGNSCSMLSGEALTPMDASWKFSWMIDAIFAGDGNGIEPLSQRLLNVTMYPNPATHQVSLDGLPTGAVVEFVDMNGKVCKSVRSGADSQAVPTDDLTPGLYLVRVTSSEGCAAMRLLVR